MANSHSTLSTRRTDNVEEKEREDEVGHVEGRVPASRVTVVRKRVVRNGIT